MTVTEFEYTALADPGSDAIELVAYNSDNREMLVRFHGGDTDYVYLDVFAGDYDGLVAASSSQRFYRQNIQGVYENDKYLTLDLVEADGNSEDVAEEVVPRLDSYTVHYGIANTLIAAEVDYVADSEEDALQQHRNAVSEMLGDVDIVVTAVTHHYA